VMGKLAELLCLLRSSDAHLCCVQESWLDASVESVNVPGFEVIARHDRNITANRGGVLVLCRTDMKNVVLLSKSADAERILDSDST